jgi:hypothetical protein
MLRPERVSVATYLRGLESTTLTDAKFGELAEEPGEGEGGEGVWCG